MRITSPVRAGESEGRAPAGAGGAATQRLAALASEHCLVAGQASQLEGLLAALARANRASTTVVEPAAAVDIHLADSLSALHLARVRDAAAVVDIGAGAGFPGLALAVALPAARVTLVESVGWRCAGIRALATAAGVVNAHVVCERAEAWPAGIGAAELVTARALAPLAVLCEYAAPLLCGGGALVAWKGARNSREEIAAEGAARELGLQPAQVVRTAPYPGCVDHHLHVYLKIGETPARFPRRPGMARKRPLGAPA